MGSAGEMESSFTIEEAASILGRRKSTTYELLAEGWLNAPCGGTRKERRGRVTQKSLFQFMLIDRVSRLPLKTLRELKNGRKHFGRIFSRNADANCLSMVEGAEKASGPNDTSPYPLPQGEGKQQNGLAAQCTPTTPCSQIQTSAQTQNNSEPKRCLHHDFAVRHQFSFGWMARQLARGDLALQDDLVQEMSLAVLEFERPASFEFLFELASNRAKNYVKYEALRGKMSLSQARQVSDAAAEKIASLNAFIDELIGRGVPVEWIEEVLGTRLERS
jgi:hypothetical protein